MAEIKMINGRTVCDETARNMAKAGGGIKSYNLSEFVELVSEEKNILDVIETFHYCDLKLELLPIGQYMIVNDVDLHDRDLRVLLNGTKLDPSADISDVSTLRRSVFISAKKTVEENGYTEIWLLHEMGYDSFIFTEGQTPEWRGFSYATMNNLAEL